jgi:hypothetical protein
MLDLSCIIIMEGDTGIAVLFCACCKRRFRGYLDRVTSADNKPICKACVIAANKVRPSLGLPPAPLCENAYLE